LLKQMSLTAAHQCALDIEDDYLGIHLPQN